MATEITYTVKGDKRVLKGLNALEQYTSGKRGLDRTLRVMGLRGKQSVSDAFKTQTDPETGKAWPDHSPVTKATKRSNRKLHETGHLLGSIHAAPLRIHQFSVTFGTNRKGARILHEGGKITPTKSKFLTIPLTREAKNAGSIKKFDQRRGTKGFFKLSKAGNLVYVVSSGGKLTAHWILLKEVLIPPRPYMGLDEDAKKDLNEIFRNDALRAYEEGRK